MAKKEYLRGRPFLTVEVTQRPAPDVNTKVKGWMNQPGAMQSFEKVSFLDRINNETNYGIIIDILNSVCVRNASSLSNDEVLATYLSNYKEQVIKAMTVWAEKEAREMALNGTVEEAVADECNKDQCEACQDDPTCHTEIPE